jgi:hypothetical protein
MIANTYAIRSTAAQRSAMPSVVSRHIARWPERPPPDFKLDGIYDGMPYRLLANGSVEVLSRGVVITFADQTAFMTWKSRG